eukprot:g26800.t1
MPSIRSRAPVRCSDRVTSPGQRFTFDWLEAPSVRAVFVGAGPELRRGRDWLRGDAVRPMNHQRSAGVVSQGGRGPWLAKGVRAGTGATCDWLRGAETFSVYVAKWADDTKMSGMTSCPQDTRNLP